MTIRNWLIRTEIKLLWKHFPHQVRDILAGEGKHVHSNPTKPKPVQQPITGQTICGQSHTARLAGGGAS